jgi:hypothetical protein
LITVLQFPMPTRQTVITTQLVMFVIPVPMILTTISMETVSVVTLIIAQQFQTQARQMLIVIALVMSVTQRMISI